MSGNNLEGDPSGFGGPELAAAAIAIIVATLLAPPAHSAEDMMGPQPVARPHAADEPLLPEIAAPTAASESPAAAYEITTQPVALRFAPPVDGQSGVQPAVVVRNDRWNLIDLDGVARISAFARGTLTAEDANLARIPTAVPRQTGTGLGFVTETPVYVGAAVRTDRSIYDFEMDRFRGARWTTSLFVGTDTALGPLYVGTNKEPDGSRATYLFLGRWF